MIDTIPVIDPVAGGLERSTLSDRPKPADGSIDVFRSVTFEQPAMDANVIDDGRAAYDSYQTS